MALRTLKDTALFTLNDPALPKTWDDAHTLLMEHGDGYTLENMAHNTHLHRASAYESLETRERFRDFLRTLPDGEDDAAQERADMSADIIVRFHITYIIRYYGPDAVDANGESLYGHVQLNSGGYKTVTTKKRMNLLTNLRVTQENWQWYVTEPRMRRHPDYLSTIPTYKYIWFPTIDGENETMEFEDGDIYVNEPETMRYP